MTGTISTTKPAAPARPPAPTAAFTLIELLVVVAIISILAMLAGVNFAEARRRADTAACASNLKTLAAALAAYRIDFNRFPPADGTAGRTPSPSHTEPGNGPAANGSWDGVPWSLISLHYLSTDAAFYCPALKRAHPNNQEHFRYAYNNSAADTFGSLGGADDLERPIGNFWIARCLWVPAERSFSPLSGIRYPHGDETRNGQTVDSDCMENALTLDLAVRITNGRRDFYSAFDLPYTPRP
ncbi:MAG: hypothetical protein Kow0059_16750 [Candidatus Sumerlaeia bacterium]